jgi:hypothetical protein
LDCNYTQIVEGDNLILGDGGKIVIHNITKKLEMLMLVACQWIKIHHEKFNLTNLDRYYKIAYKIPSSNKFDQNIDCLQQCQQTFKKVSNV